MSEGVDAEASEADSWGPLDGLPGNPMIWILILGELIVFGVLLTGFVIVSLLRPGEFAAARVHLDPALATGATVVLITSGWLAALALERVRGGKSGRALLVAAMASGSGFLVLKGLEYAEKFAAGIGLDSGPFFTLYFLITGFHAMHVMMGLIVLAIVTRHHSEENVETGTAFWHMVDLIWVLVFPVIYLVGGPS